MLFHRSERWKLASQAAEERELKMKQQNAINVDDDQPGASTNAVLFLCHCLQSDTSSVSTACAGLLESMVSSACENHLVQQRQEFPGHDATEHARNAMALTSADINEDVMLQGNVELRKCNQDFSGPKRNSIRVQKSDGSAEVLSVPQARKFHKDNPLAARSRRPKKKKGNPISMPPPNPGSFPSTCSSSNGHRTIGASTVTSKNHQFSRNQLVVGPVDPDPQSQHASIPDVSDEMMCSSSAFVSPPTGAAVTGDTTAGTAVAGPLQQPDPVEMRMKCIRVGLLKNPDAPKCKACKATAEGSTLSRQIAEDSVAAEISTPEAVGLLLSHCQN